MDHQVVQKEGGRGEGRPAVLHGTGHKYGRAAVGNFQRWSWTGKRATHICRTNRDRRGTESNIDSDDVSLVSHNIESTAGELSSAVASAASSRRPSWRRRRSKRLDCANNGDSANNGDVAQGGIRCDFQLLPKVARRRSLSFLRVTEPMPKLPC